MCKISPFNLLCQKCFNKFSQKVFSLARCVSHTMTSQRSSITQLINEVFSSSRLRNKNRINKIRNKNIKLINEIHSYKITQNSKINLIFYMFYHVVSIMTFCVFYRQAQNFMLHKAFCVNFTYHINFKFVFKNFVL